MSQIHQVVVWLTSHVEALVGITASCAVIACLALNQFLRLCDNRKVKYQQSHYIFWLSLLSVFGLASIGCLLISFLVLIEK